jgi:hypothetical protein
LRKVPPDKEKAAAENDRKEQTPPTEDDPRHEAEFEFAFGDEHDRPDDAGSHPENAEPSADVHLPDRPSRISWSQRPTPFWSWGAKQARLRIVARRSPEYTRFLRRLRLAREEAGLSQAETARRLGKGQAYVWKSEVGERRVDAVELKAFARVYSVPVSFFYE